MDEFERRTVLDGARYDQLRVELKRIALEYDLHINDLSIRERGLTEYPEITIEFLQLPVGALAKERAKRLES